MNMALTRRALLAQGTIATGVAWCGLLRPASAHAQTLSPTHFPIADTADGRVRGITYGAIHRFLGIRYGASTAGANRFRPPQPVASWKGVQTAFGYGQFAPQLPADIGGEYARLIDWDKQFGGMGEDCLVLNVWTPGLADGKKRPVFVSFHGGGFSSGSGSSPGFSGDPLARYGDAVVITVNHRLNLFGCIQLSDIGGKEFAHAGNAGMLDLVAALKWVRANAEAFGGDPGNVTIFGQSGGGRKVSAMLSLPDARGLFHRAIVESGSINSLIDRDSASKAARALLDTLGIAPANVAKLRDVPMIDLLEAMTRMPGLTAFGFMPVLDGDTYPAYPALQNSASVPLIVGSTLDESAVSMTDYGLDRAGLQAWATKRFGTAAPRILAAFAKAYPSATPFFQKVRIDTQWDRRARTIRQADQRVNLGGTAPTWMYRIDAPAPVADGKFGAVHGLEVALTFHNTLETLTTEAPPYIHQLAGQFADIWLAFARTGDPNNASIPHWPAYNGTTRPTLLLDKTTRVANDPDHDLRLLCDAVGPVGAPRD